MYYFVAASLFIFSNNNAVAQRIRMMRVYSRRLVQYNTHTCNQARQWKIALASNHRKIINCQNPIIRKKGDYGIEFH